MLSIYLDSYFISYLLFVFCYILMFTCGKYHLINFIGMILATFIFCIIFGLFFMFICLLLISAFHSFISQLLYVYLLCIENIFKSIMINYVHVEHYFDLFVHYLSSMYVHVDHIFVLLTSFHVNRCIFVAS